MARATNLRPLLGLLELIIRMAATATTRTFLSVESFEVKKALQYEDRDDGAFWMSGIPKTPTRAQLDGIFLQSENVSDR